MAPDSVQMKLLKVWGSALALVEKMRSCGLDPNLNSYSAVISSCEKGARWGHALQLLDDLRCCYLEPSLASYGAAIFASYKCGHLDDGVRSVPLALKDAHH